MLLLKKVEPPDIKITFTDLNSQTDIKRKIELKSCKSKSRTSISGSTIRTLDLNTWVIFCRRNEKNSNFEFRYGRYYLGLEITETELFQDRTPRPHLYWNNYQPTTEAPKIDKINDNQEWIYRYAKAAINRISGKYPKIQHSWQDDLVRQIIKIAITEEKSLLKKIIEEHNESND